MDGISFISNISLHLKEYIIQFNFISIKIKQNKIISFLNPFEHFKHFKIISSIKFLFFTIKIPEILFNFLISNSKNRIKLK